jgi:hypothetical protein
MRWRVETYSGQWAEGMTDKNVLSFLWKSRWELFSYLAWMNRLTREARKKA